MYFLYATGRDEDEDVPPEKREWWYLRFKHESKEEVLQWHQTYKREGIRYKLLCTDRNLKDCFYPHKEKKTNTATGKMLRKLL